MPQKFVKSKTESKAVVLKQNKNEKRIGEKNTIEEIEGKFVDNMSGHEVIVQEGRRMITYQISKNKGLTPHRNKEQRNPRVKHRNKYRKAKIRRKGAVSITYITIIQIILLSSVLCWDIYTLC